MLQTFNFQRAIWIIAAWPLLANAAAPEAFSQPQGPSAQLHLGTPKAAVQQITCQPPNHNTFLRDQRCQLTASATRKLDTGGPQLHSVELLFQADKLVEIVAEADASPTMTRAALERQIYQWLDAIYGPMERGPRPRESGRRDRLRCIGISGHAQPGVSR